MYRPLELKNLLLIHRRKYKNSVRTMHQKFAEKNDLINIAHNADRKTAPLGAVQI